MKLTSNFVACFVLILVAGVSIRSVSAGDCCQRCGRDCECRRVCHCVPFDKKVQVVCWGCSEKEICIPDPSIRGCEHREDVCDNCPHGCRRNHGIVWWDWTPCGAKTLTKRKLMKKVVTRKIPSYKWVTEDLCDACASDCAQPTPSGKPTNPIEPTPADSPAKPVKPRLSSSQVE